MPDYESPNVDETGPERVAKDPRRFDGQYPFGWIRNVDHATIIKWAKAIKKQFGIDPEIQQRSHEV